MTQIINVSELSPSWNWLAHRFPSNQFAWRHCSTHSSHRMASRFSTPMRRIAAALDARQLIASYNPSRSIIVSHGPRPALYVELLARRARDKTTHLVFSFNFTDLPTGARRLLMCRYLDRADRFVVASSVERTVYSEYFAIGVDKIDVLLWSIEPPLEELAKPARFGDEPYICAIGSQARDYETLIAAMRLIPAIKLVLVASPDSLPGALIPKNVTVLTNIPLADAMNVLAHSQFMVLPLRDSQVPCGHVTVVSAMHMGKAILATDSVGLHDYLIADRNAEFFSPKNPGQLAERIEWLFARPSLYQKMGSCGSAFAQKHCTEDGAVSYFRRFLDLNGVAL